MWPEPFPTRLPAQDTRNSPDGSEPPARNLTPCSTRQVPSANGRAAARTDRVRVCPSMPGDAITLENPMPSKKLEKKERPSPRGKSSALQKPLQPSQELAAVVGPGSLPRTEVVSKVWDYIRSHNLQNPENRREILADDKLRKVFGKDKVTMFEMNKHLAQHLT